MATSEHLTHPTEASPLLSSRAVVQHEDHLRVASATEIPATFPTTQVLLLCYARLMEPIAFFSIFPYIAMMVQTRGQLADADVGFYAGLVESVFSVVQTFVLLFWGSLADRFGRRPVLIASLTGMAVGPALFGLSRNLWQMMVFRALTGAFSGANLIIRTMIGELCDGSTQVKAIAWYTIAGNIGIICGPVIGGALVDPAIQYPSVFGNVPFLKSYPYALPGFVVGSLGLTACLSLLLCVDETWDSSSTSDTDDDSQDEGNGGHKEQDMTTGQILKNPKTLTVLGVFTYVMILCFAFSAILPVVLYTPIDLGGMGYSPSSITVYMTSLGISETVWMLIAFPFLQTRVRTKGVMRLCAYFWPAFFAGYILMNAVLRAERTTENTVFYCLVWAANVIFGSGIWMAFAAAQLAVNEVSPNRTVLGKLNSVAEICSSVSRTVVPPLSTSLFAVGIGGQIIGGHLAWVVLILLTLGLPVALHWFPDSEASGWSAARW
ncbi:Major facilitator superfamily transporter [Cordyceps militaris]|uniref:Major facilitator superfamily transporter n=1 Tax=Cordyceps militaris TaxID=73501 RepID=A0A2H4SN60_CORMI|nr:Major facilitator superfamily transporter [Cordyceps militaris]